MARKAACDFTVEGTCIGVRANLEMAGLSTLLFGVVASFIVGDLLDEDSTGWACFDFTNITGRL